MSESSPNGAPPTGAPAGPDRAELRARMRLVLTVVLVAAAGGAVAQASGSGGGDPAAAAVDAVRTAALACPAPVVRGADATSSVSLAVPPAAAVEEAVEGAAAEGAAGAARDTTGRATLTDIGGTKVRGRLAAPGGARVDVGSAAVPAQLAQGTRAMAAGLSADLLTHAGSGASRGLAATPCVLPGATAWFVGAGTAAGRRGRLFLANVDATAATLDLSFFSEKGAVDVPNAREVTVPPRSVREMPLEGMAPGHARLAVGVTVARGRVAAALHDLDSAGTVARGIDWVAAVPSPSTTVVIPGLPEGPLGRRLQLLAPGDGDATVRVRLLTGDNDFAPAGLDAVELPAGRVGEYDLGEAANDEAAAVLVTSDVPVVAAVRLTRTSKGVTDVAYATGAAPLATPAVLPDVRGRTALSERIMLTAPTGAATVTLRPLAGASAGKPTTVTLAAGRSALVDPGAAGGRQHAVLVAAVEGSAPVYAARVLRAGWTDISVTPVRGGRFTVVIPDVVADVGAATAEEVVRPNE